MQSTVSTPTFRYRPMRMEPEYWGEIRSSLELFDDVEALRQRIAEDGYLFFPGMLPAQLIADAREEILRRLARLDLLDPGYPAEEGVAVSGVVRSSANELAGDNPELDRAIYGEEVLSFFRRFLGGEVRHYDHTWLRVKAPGDDNAARPHCDIVFMGRGTKRLYTGWIPMMDIPLAMGGLMILENSHRNRHIISTYGTLDVDTYCTNGRDASEIEQGEKRWQDWVKRGEYSDDAFEVQDEIGGRWLSRDYSAGDVLVFNMYLMHASMDNHTDRFRISTDSRYQLASEPVDERWIGEHPPGHGPGGKRGMIC